MKGHNPETEDMQDGGNFSQVIMDPFMYRVALVLTGAVFTSGNSWYFPSWKYTAYFTKVG